MSKTTDYKVQWTPELREAVDNRIIDYLSQGYSQQEAEEKALQDQLDHTTFIQPEVTVIAQAPVQKQVAVESDWDPGYTKFMSGEQYYADQDHKNYLDWQRNDYTRGIREATDKWGKGIGLGMTAAVAAPFVVQAAPVVGSALKWGLTTPVGQAATKKFIGDALLGTAGYMGFDALSTAVTDKTFGQNVADITGNVPGLKEIPYNWREFAGSLVQPGGYMALGKGQVAANLLNRAERTAGKVARTSKDYVASNYNYLKNTKFKGVPEGGNMEAYVPKTVKQNVETGVKGTIQQLENLGVTDLPQITTTYENMPLTGSYMGHTGDLHVGFDSKTLHNPFRYWKVYNEKPGLGLNYSFMAGHEPVHLVHPSRAHYMKASGEPMLYEGNPVVKGFGTVRGQFDISQQKYYLDPKTNTFYPEPGTYYTAPDELLEMGLFKDLNKPRQNIMKGLPNTPQSQAHLRAPQEMDADLYALYNMGHIKNGQVSDEGIQFLMQRHNLSKEGVLNTIDDLQVIGYGNALSGEPITATWVPGNQYTRSAFVEAAPSNQSQVVLSSAGNSNKPTLNIQELLPEEKILLQNLKDSGYDVSKLTRDQLEDISFSMSDALQGRSEGIIRSGDTYYLVNEDGLTGALKLESLEDGAVAPLWIENFSKSGGNPQKGVSEKLYNQAIRDNKGGLVSGGMLEDAGATLRVLDKFPNKQVRGNYGQYIFKNGPIKFNQPVYLLTEPSASSKIPSATIDWRSVKDGIIPELIWKKQGGTLNYLNYFN